jgi:hypothetical protein
VVVAACGWLSRSPKAPRLSGDLCGGLHLVENRVGPRPKQLAEAPGPYGGAQYQHRDARPPKAQLAYRVGAVPFGQGQVQDRHVQTPIEASPVERLPGLGQGARLGDHPQLRLAREHEGQGFAEGRVVLHQLLEGPVGERPGEDVRGPAAGRNQEHSEEARERLTRAMRGLLP